MNDNLSYTLGELAAKVGESVFKFKKDGKIEFERLTDSDRAVVERGLQQLKHGLDLLDSDDPKVLRGAALDMLVGASLIVPRTRVSDSVKKYIDVERDGAKGRKGAITRQKNMQIWQDHVREKLPELRRKNRALTPDGLAEKIRLANESPVPLPCHDRLVRFIRAERKSGATKKTNPPRLVDG